jgi:hypothetical protein
VTLAVEVGLGLLKYPPSDPSHCDMLVSAGSG